MKIRSEKFEAQCWRVAKEYFVGLDKKEIIGFIESIAKKRMKR